MTCLPLQIAPLAQQDIRACAAIMANSEPWTRYGIDDAGALSVWRTALADGAAVSVARSGPLTCGFAWYISRGAFGLSGYLKLLGVSQEVRGQGVGTALLIHTEQQARASGHRDLFLLVSHFNEAAQRFYRGHGYTNVGALAGYVHPDITELIYRKRLRPGGDGDKS